ncbi:MAG TPA: alpha/beta hydrolase [Pyrinomonadaceae bacterium]|jgi:acetyl esterase|nr:alpha/beta hydrolase [Pyrinomonadaceae bacterium]
MNLDSDMQGIIDQFMKFGAPSIELLSPDNARNNPTLKNAVEEMAANSALTRTMNVAMPALPEPVEAIKHILIPGGKGDVLARVYYPNTDKNLPVIIYFHGGGWVIANLDVYEPSCRALCNAAKAIVVSVAYRQAPEHKCPAAVEDAYEATNWIMENAAQLGGDPARVAIAGESAGGNLATVTCQFIKENGGKMPVAQLLVYPVTDARGGYRSYEENVNSAPLKTAMMMWFFKHYLKTDTQKLEKYVSPILGELSGLPPAIVITAEFDPLRDEGEAYAQKLAEAGVSVKSKCFDGVSHEFFGLAGAVGKAKDALDFAVEGLQRVFELKAETVTAKI